MFDGARLRQSWYTALDDAQASFRQLLTSHSSPEWKRVVASTDGASTSSKGKARASATPVITDVVLHRKYTQTGENVYRAVLEVPAGDASLSLDSWKSVLATPELRQEWDPAVESAQMLEMFDQATRISKTKFTLGWPASPRDAVTISRTFNDATTLIDISTSLPRSPDEPVYLRPSPPYVRSDVGLFAWCIQLIQPPPSDQQQKSSGKLRITCFWQHNLRLIWNLGPSTSLAQQLCAMTVGLFKTVQKRGNRIPILSGYGNGVSVERVRFQIDREALTLDYSIVPEDEESPLLSNEQGLDELHAIREHRRLTRCIECKLPASQGWDVQLTTKASSEQVSQLPWTVHATRRGPSPSASDYVTAEQDKVTLDVKHAPLPNDHSVLKVRVVIELSGPSSGVRLNGVPHPIEEVEERDPSFFMSQPMLQDASSTADLSFQTQSSVSTVASSPSRSSTIADRPQLVRTITERTAAAEKSIFSRVKRNYIYFSSLLQEPEAKWKRTTEARGVSIAQLDSIDPTLVVYRAEATFVGLGLWDLYSAVVTPGARAYWDKLYEDGVLLEDVNELTELWHFKTKPAWPINGRDAVVLKTVYKSPTTIHVFAFSADDPNLFPNIPPVEPNVIRTQIDLQGWAIEALSPTTTQLTLLEQSDPKGWSNKASIPQQMINAVAGVGEYAIKCGGPPVATRLEGAKTNDVRYDHERGLFRLEYEACSRRRTASDKTTDGAPSSPGLTTIECELRCDLDNWASSLDIVVDPPPHSISCLRRHRLSYGGGGLWLTITHDAVYSSDERLLTIVRRGPSGASKDKGLVMVNGAKVDVDVEELPEREVKNLTKQKRVKPTRVPLDQPPVLGTIRRRRAEWTADADKDGGDSSSGKAADASPKDGVTVTTPRYAASIGNFFTYAVQHATTTTQQAVAAMSPVSPSADGTILSSSIPPMQYALEALAYLQSMHTRPLTDEWTLVSEKDIPVHRKLAPEVSPTIPVHRGGRVLEGVSADEIAPVLSSYACRAQWDTRFGSAQVLEAYGADAHTAFVTMKGGFPFRDRGFYLASLVARESAGATPSRRNTGESEQPHEGRSAIFCVTASFSPDSAASFSANKYNPFGLPVGRVFVDGWILETLDPYADENYAIPSTRCTRVVAVDYAGSIPAAMNSSINATMPKSILALESYIKGISPSPSIRLPAAGVVVHHATDDGPLNKSWTLRRRDPNRVLISTQFNPTDKVYRTVMLLDSSTALSGSSPVVSHDKTPKASKATLNFQATPSRETLRDGRSTDSRTAPPSTHTDTEPTPDRPRSRDAARSPTMFTSRGEVRHPTDLLVSEIVVDSKLFPDGYELHVRARLEKTKARLALADAGNDGLAEGVLPMTCSAFTLPPSPLHSSGLNADPPPRHLLRLHLPTAQYQVSTIQDPLTGETRTAPPKPQWLTDLEEGRAIIAVEIRSATAGRATKGTVAIDGASVAVLSEKESLTVLGRDELLDGRTSKMDLLARSAAEAEQLPDKLQTPLAVAEHLLDAGAQTPQMAPAPDAREAESIAATPEPSPEASESGPQVAPAPAEPQAGDSPAAGLLRFFNGYPNTLLRLAGPMQRSVSGSGSTPEARVGGAETKTAVAVREAAGARRAWRGYPLSTVLVIALIAFLIGSLLRSLVSPADFVYVVTDPRDAETEKAGWREVRRLLELKYIVGGWDFQVAVVRRH
ncbi:hypothetical protein CERSUDRAFT_112974 [Gelatoporia subvermispora B]|uniref:START domain-containing protein n=1 Tax=Ceriporiopsis subvermispora (strain B) TaxID=914234 RepID=M2RKI2_CERS8|nr:hypothetical protein CERSUDRAFT_112974 [Gelatoporia subvermispora B]